MFKIGFGLILLGLIFFVVREMYKQGHLDSNREKRDDLLDVLAETKKDLEDADVEEEAIDAKILLQKRNDQIAKKSDKLK